MDLETTTLPHLLDTVSEIHPDEEAIVSGDRRLTYSEFHSAVTRVARGLLANGVRKGDAVGVMMSNRPEWLIATHAIVRIGAKMVGLNTWYKPDELEYALRKTDVSTLVTIDSFLGNEYLEHLLEIDPGIEDSDGTTVNSSGIPFLRNVVIVGETPSWAQSWDDLLSDAEGVSHARLEAATEEVEPADDAYVLFSSGTTGRPKPIVLRHDGLVTNARSIGARLGVGHEDRFWLALPLFFSFAACNESITALAHGSTIVLQERFDPEVAIETIRDERCTVVYGMGNMFKQLENVDADLKEALEGVRIGLMVAPEPLRRRYEERYDVMTAHGYGLTEVCAICTLTDVEGTRANRLETAGQPFANVDIRIKDPETGEEVVPGAQGEVCIRSRTLFRTYYKMPDRTRAVFDPDGYFHTGDLGRLDPNGRLVFEGRLKDMIKTGGINVSPQEVQNVLTQHPAVDEAVVIGLPDEERDEIVAAVIRTAISIDEDELVDYCRERMASYKVPRAIEFRAADFPRTDTGKVQRRRVQEEYRDR